MKRLLVLRHAKSSWRDQALDDHERPLNKRGRRDAPRIGLLMERRGLLPQIAITSSALRARATLELALEPREWAGEIRVSPRVYGASATEIVDVLGETPGRYDRLLLVGHNPTLEELVAGLTGRAVALPTGALAVIDGAWSDWGALALDGAAELVALYTPRRLDDEDG
ncbi:MAG TPA: histidine phosphatase family protein [Candidatus Polarisedimenticolaceae bacterium]|nr:histidine phosphatase family protein [Candidatus Polarisedimenticolaceae bacterium]